jgi:hypothetical protein
MEQYKNLAGNSGVARFEIGTDFITVMFQDGKTYLYTYASAGEEHIETMKHLALGGIGLCTYINQHVREAYEARLA